MENDAIVSIHAHIDIIATFFVCCCCFGTLDHGRILCGALLLDIATQLSRPPARQQVTLFLEYSTIAAAIVLLDPIFECGKKVVRKQGFLFLSLFGTSFGAWTQQTLLVFNS